MNQAAQNDYVQRLFARSCLESSPRPIEPRPGTFCPGIPAGSRSKSQLYQLKHELLLIALEEVAKVGLFKQICGAASQAAELAWNESCPLLIFPCLFEELVQNVREQLQREQVWQIDELLQPPTVAENSDADGGQHPGILFMPSRTA